MRVDQPPLEYLVTSSQASLEAFELARLNRCANLRKELRDVIEEWLQMEVDARLARWILECRRVQTADPGAFAAAPENHRVGQLALSFLPELGAAHTDTDGQHAGARAPSPRPAPADRSTAANGITCARDSSTMALTTGRPADLPSKQPMTSNDAIASLRLLEQFLARPAQSAGAPVLNLQLDEVASAIAAAVPMWDFPEPLPSASGGAPRSAAGIPEQGSFDTVRKRLQFPGGGAATRSAAVVRRKLHASPPVRSVASQTARYRWPPGECRRLGNNAR
jgi:hypothetical protein